jgi:hypothetical protein
VNECRREREKNSHTLSAEKDSNKTRQAEQGAETKTSALTLLAADGTTAYTVEKN